MLRRFQSLALAAVAATAFAPAVHGGSIGSAHAAHERLYQTLVSLRDDNPARFDRLHPFYGKLLSDPADFAYWTDRWKAAPARFEVNHPCLWRTLDGGSGVGGLPQTPIVPPNLPILPPQTPIVPPNLPIVPPSCPGGGGVVPEPASVGMCGFGLMMLVIIRRRLSGGGR